MRPSILWRSFYPQQESDHLIWQLFPLHAPAFLYVYILRSSYVPINILQRVLHVTLRQCLGADSEKGLCAVITSSHAISFLFSHFMPITCPPPQLPRNPQLLPNFWCTFASVRRSDDSSASPGSFSTTRYSIKALTSVTSPALYRAPHRGGESYSSPACDCLWVASHVYLNKSYALERP